MLICIAIGSSVAAFSNELQNEHLMLELINRARRDPLTIINELGVDITEYLSDEEINEIGKRFPIPPVVINEMIYQVAKTHTEDMLINGYYSSKDLNGKTVDDRIKESGYISYKTGEVLGILAFGNYIDPDQAVNLLFSSMIKDQLKDFHKSLLFDDEFIEVGIFIGTGIVNIGGQINNAYIVACDFVNPLQPIEMQLFKLLNESRKNPLSVASKFGVDKDRLLEKRSDIKDILINGVPLVKYNATLKIAANEHVLDMLANEYFSHFSMDGKSYYERIYEKGYDGVGVGESIGKYAFCSNIPIETIGLLLFKSIFINELKYKHSEELSILNPIFNEVGLSYIAGNSKILGGICGEEVNLMVVNLGFSN
ncbi:MAG: hypothetical protein HQK76_00330 [Desulfobacterales bacterium]|nr:hypothetical protein [Desulfobacterales bacterium]